jgi:hypothetical protein
VRAEEIEMFLSSCKGGILAQALSRTRKEVYKCQMSLHQLESASNRAAAAARSSGNGAQPKQSDPSSTSVKVLNNIMYHTFMKVEPVYYGTTAYRIKEHDLIKGVCEDLVCLIRRNDKFQK